MSKRQIRKPHQLVRERLSGTALAGGRKLYLSSGVRDLRVDVRRRRYSAHVEDGEQVATVKIEQTKGEPTWFCSVHGTDDIDCPHVAALLTAIREREAIDAPEPDSTGKGAANKKNFVDHMLDEAKREHLVHAFKLCLKSYPELQGDLVFTILEGLDTDGELYEEVVRLMDNPTSSKDFVLPEDGFDHFRLIDELNYLYEQKKYQQSFLLARGILVHFLNKLPKSRKPLTDEEVDLIVSSTGLLSDLTIPPVPEQLTEQVHGLALKLLRQHPRLDPQFQSSLIALLSNELMNDVERAEVEQLVRKRWERARKAGGETQTELAEQLAMPLALLLARIQQFDKLQHLFDQYLQNPILRAPALAEMLQHNMIDVVLDYVRKALVIPHATVHQLDPEDIARCGMYNDLVMMTLESLPAERIEDKISLLKRAFHSIGYRVYDLVDLFRDYTDEEVYQHILNELYATNETPGDDTHYPTVVKRFILLCELARIDEAFQLIADSEELDPIIVLAFLPQFFPTYQEQLFHPALKGITELLPIAVDDNLRGLIKQTISLLWNVNEEALRKALEKHYLTIDDDELASFVEDLLDDLNPSDYGLAE